MGSVHFMTGHSWETVGQFVHHDGDGGEMVCSCTTCTHVLESSTVLHWQLRQSMTMEKRRHPCMVNVLHCSLHIDCFLVMRHTIWLASASANSSQLMCHCSGTWALTMHVVSNPSTLVKGLYLQSTHSSACFMCFTDEVLQLQC